MIYMLSFRNNLTEDAGISRLWQKFHHLSEHDKLLVLTITEAVGRSQQDVQILTEQADELCGEVLRENKEENK